MKYLFYVLVVINLVFLIWKFGLEQRDAWVNEEMNQSFSYHKSVPGALAGNEDDPELTPVSPSQPDNADAASSDENGDSDAQTANRNGCFEIGPIQDREVAQGYMTLLAPGAKGVRLAIYPGDVPDGWWVIFPKASTLEAAHANRRMLENQGIYDTWLFDKGPLQGAISLGLYKSRAEADKALQALLEKGVQARVMPRLVRGEVFWVKIPWSGLPMALEENVQILNSQDPTLNMPVPVTCR